MLCPWGKWALKYIFSKFNPLNTDTFYGPLSVRITGLWLYFHIRETAYGGDTVIANS